jgi:hypothetical protein
MDTTFNAKLSKTALTITIFFHIILILALFLIRQNPNYGFLSVLTIVASLVLTHSLHPVSYTIVPDCVRINRPVLPIIIQDADIIQLEKTNVSDLSISLRLLGSGGVWGYFGIYHSSIHGKLIMMATDMQNLVLIVTPTKKYVISPEHPKDFLETYTNRRKIN